MKKITLFLSVLLMAMVVKAQSEPVTTTYDFEDGNAMFVADSRITTAVEDGLGYDGSKAVHFTCANNAQNGYSFAHFDISTLVVKPKTVTFDFQYYNTDGGRAILSIGDADVRGNGSICSKSTYSNKGAIFALGSDKNNALINGSSKTKSDFCNKWMDVVVTVNVIDKNYSYTIKESGSSTELASAENVAYYSADALACTQIDLFGYINNNKCAYIDNLKITVEQDNRQYADYTIAYVDEGGSAIKDDVIRNGVVGETIELVDADKVAFKNTDNTKKYFYKSDDAASKTIVADGTAKVVVTFREAATYSYTVNAVDANDNVLKVIAKSSNFEGEKISVPYNQYILKSGVLYTASGSGDRGLEFNHSVTLSANNTVSNVAYTISSLENVVYFNEVEEIVGMTKTTNTPANVRCSNSTGAYNASETPVEVLTLTPGTYTIHTQFVGGHATDASKNVDFTITCGDESLVVTTNGSPGTGNKEFTITENTKVTVLKAGDSSKCLDWILIQSAEANSLLAVVDGKDLDAATGTYAAATYTRTVNPEYTYGTICLPFAPDAATLENYTFYAIDAPADNALTFVEETAPKAYIPYLYSAKDKEATTHTFTGGETVIESEPDCGVYDYAPWSFFGALTEEYYPAEELPGEYFAYKPTAEGEDVIVHASKSITISPYRAYFMYMNQVGGWDPGLLTTMRIVVRGAGDNGDGTTAIEEVITPDQIEGAAPAIYNLMGQPVAQPVKGQIYIVNGKKVVY